MALTTIDDRGLKTPIDLLDNEKIRFGTGNDLEVYHNGTHSFLLNNIGNLILSNMDPDIDNEIHLRARQNESSIVCKNDGGVELYYNNVKKLETTDTGILIDGSNTTGSEVRGDFRFKSEGSATTKILWNGDQDLMRWQDNTKATFGTGNDLEIYHTGSESVIKDTGTGPLYIQASDKIVFEKGDGSEKLAIFNEDGAVELYYDNVKKAETYSSGLLINGSLSVEGNNISIHDNGKLKCGTSDDLQIYHDGSHSRIVNSTGALSLQGDDINIKNAASDETMAALDANGAVSLFYDNVKKFETASAGVIVTGSSVNHGLRINTSMTTYGVINVRDADDANIACLQAENGAAGNDKSNLILRSVDLNSSNWAGAKYNAQYHQFNYQNTSKLRIDNDGIKFGSDTSADTALNDYEQGTFTPNWVGLENHGSTTTSANVASYVKVGRMCSVGGYTVITGMTGSGSLGITNLPFSAPNGNDYLRTGSFFCDTVNFNSDWLWLVTYKIHNTTNMAIYASRDNAGWESLGCTTGSFIWSLTYMTS